MKVSQIERGKLNPEKMQQFACQLKGNGFDTSSKNYIQIFQRRSDKI
jgi:hypothetical protein